MQPANIYFVLVRPTFLGNIGSVARVMKNFGFRNLRLIDPPRNYKDAEARKMALGAFDLLKAAECFDSLAEALKDINIAVGTTCAHQRVCSTQPITELAASLKNKSVNRIAIIFGEERDGLKVEDLERCQLIASIPSNPEFPSLNLAQAAGIFAYELTRPASSKSAGDSKLELELAGDIEAELEPEFGTELGAEVELANGSDADQFLEQLAVLLHEVGFTKSFNKTSIMSELRVLYNKANPSAREQLLLNALLKKFAGQNHFRTRSRTR